MRTRQKAKAAAIRWTRRNDYVFEAELPLDGVTLLVVESGGEWTWAVEGGYSTLSGSKRAAEMVVREMRRKGKR